MSTITATGFMPVENERRLSPWRLLLGLLIIGAASVFGYYGFTQWHASASVVSTDPWFASYVDVTATPSYPFENGGTGVTRDVILSFIVSPKSGDPCTPAWGGAYTLDQASDSLDLDRRIARLHQQGGNVAVSFGGQKNKELAVGCNDPTRLAAAYESVINRYDISTIDLDLENSGLSNTQAASVRASAIQHVQESRRAQGKYLAVWVTLPVTPQGLSDQGAAAVSTLLKNHVDLAGVNAMTMDYGNTLGNQSMASASKSALTQMHRQLGVLYTRAGIYLNEASLWSKTGATPMIGQNDDEDQVFSLNDALELNSFAANHHIGRMSMWSANRDKTCGSNYVTTSVVSDSCSGINQKNQSFAVLLGNNFKGNIASSAGKQTAADTKSKESQIPDDPKTSPYQIWSKDGAYLQGTKVVWHHNVYEAKWWTQGDTPDDPVLQAYETPWTLIGPVLPGEKPVKQATLPEGTYADWNVETAYETGTRILFNGVPYQSKWWNKGESPAAASSNPTSSPWTPLTQEEIEKIKAATS